MIDVKCFCGECESENNYYECKSCNRVVPWCFGASDKYWEYCDDCAVKLFEKEDTFFQVKKDRLVEDNQKKK